MELEDVAGVEHEVPKMPEPLPFIDSDTVGKHCKEWTCDEEPVKFHMCMVACPAALLQP